MAIEMSMDIRITQSSNNGGEFFVYTDNNLMGVYAHLEKVAERLSEEVSSRVLALAEDEKEEESGDCFYCGAVMESDGCTERCQG